MVLACICIANAQASATVTELQTEESIAQLIRQRGVQPASNTSIWACLARLTDYKTGAPIALQGLAINIALFFLAGYETTAHTAIWALFELAAQPQLQVASSSIPCSTTHNAEQSKAVTCHCY